MSLLRSNPVMNAASPAAPADKLVDAIFWDYHVEVTYSLLSGKWDDHQKEDRKYHLGSLRWRRIHPRCLCSNKDLETLISTYLKVMGAIPLNMLSGFFSVLIDHAQQSHHRRMNSARTKLICSKYINTSNLNSMHTGCLIYMDIIFRRLRGQDGTVDVSGCNKV